MSYRCDHCGMGIAGLRWRCQGGCSNYDLCARCHNNPSGVWKGGHTRRHLEVAYHEPGGSAASFFCNTCGGTIANRRWACQTCLEYDLCDACHSRGMGFAAPHNVQHDMSLFLEPGCRPAQFTCDHCRSAIVSGTRYHCLSGCNDFDLCQSCYNMRPNVGMHNASHAMKAVSEPGSFPINVIPGGYPSPSPQPFPVAGPAAPGVHVGFNPTGISINISTGPAVPQPQMSVGIAPQTSPYGQRVGVMPGMGLPGAAVPQPAPMNMGIQQPPQSSMYPNYPQTSNHQPSYPQPSYPQSSYPQTAPTQPSVGFTGGQATVTSYGPTQSSSAYPPTLGGSSQPAGFGSSGMYPGTFAGQPSYPAPQSGGATVTSYGYNQPGGAVVTSQGPTQPYNSFVMNPTPPGSAHITSMGPTNPPGSF